MRWLARSICVVALAAGCSSSDIELAVDLKTDYVAGVELTSVETTLLPPGSAAGATGPVRQTAAFLGDNFTSARRVADFGGLAPGGQLVRVRLRDRTGATLASRDTRVDLRSSFVITVVITRDCSEVTCPSATGDPDATECVGGSCVAPTCVPETPGSCPAPQCTTASTCPLRAACAVARCESGSCLYDSTPDACAVREWCSPVAGCVPLPSDYDAGVPDAGLSGVDAGPSPMVDAGPSPTMDAGPSPTVDAGPSPMIDAGPSPTTDAGPSDAGGRAVFTASGDSTFFVPPGVTRITLLAWGAGGGGGAGTFIAGGAGGAGGGGGFATGTFDVTPGASLRIRAGGGGAGGASGADSEGGGGGGASVVDNAALMNLLTAPGGGGGGGVRDRGGAVRPGGVGGAGGGASGVSAPPGGPEGGGGATATAPGAGGTCGGVCGGTPGRAGVGGRGGDGGDFRGGTGGGGQGGQRDGGRGGGRAGGGGGGEGLFGGGGGHSGADGIGSTGGGGGSARSTAVDAYLEAGSGVAPGGAARPELGVGFGHGGAGGAAGAAGPGANGEPGRVIVLW